MNKQEEIVNIIHSNCPYTKPCPVYNQGMRAIKEVVENERHRGAKNEVKRIINEDMSVGGYINPQKLYDRLAELSTNKGNHNG